MSTESNLRCECGEPLRIFWLCSHQYYCCDNCNIRFNIKDSGCWFRFMREIDVKTGKIGKYNHSTKKYDYG